MRVPHLFHYSDYRAFLRDLYEKNKAEDIKFSYRFFAQKLGFSSSASLKLITENKRNLSKKSMMQICKGLGLLGRQAEYFENLVFWNQSTNPEEFKYYQAKVHALQDDSQMVAIEKARQNYFEKWYHSALRELVCQTPNLSDEAIGKLLVPVVSPQEVRTSINMMLESGFLKKENGQYYQTEPVIGLWDARYNQLLIDYQKQMLHKASESYENFKAEERVASGTTFGVSEETYKEFITLMRDFRSKLTNLARKDPKPERVYHLGIQLFPLSQKHLA